MSVALRWRTTVSALAAVTLVASGCADNTPRVDPPLDAPPAGANVAGAGEWTPEPVEWQACDAPNADGLDCASVTVPLDWNELDGTTIDLAVRRDPATGDRLGVLFTNPGGPGASGIQYLTGHVFSKELSERFDIVSWDPRGVGESAPLQCGSASSEFLQLDPTPNDAAAQARLDDAAAAIATECGELDGEMLRNIGTDSTARDLDALRMSLGQESLNFVGFSYGSLLGLRYLELFGEHARAIVLDGVVDPTQPLVEWLANQAVALDTSLDDALDACDADAQCPLDDPDATLDELRADAVTDDSGLSEADLALGSIYATYEPALWPRLWEAMAEADAGDPTAMVGLADSYRDLAGYAAYVAIECVDGPHPTDAEEYAAFAATLEADAPGVGGAVANELLPCATWPVEPSSVIGPVTGADGPPVLVLGSRGDAATPYANSVNVAAMLHDAHLVSLDSVGHTSYGRTDCVDEVVDQYLISLAVPERDPDCD